MQGGLHALHKILGFRPEKHVVNLLLRDPFDNREMPPNGKDFISANCIRGVRKVTTSNWRDYALACDPDIVLALPDIVFTSGTQSQKRITKSIERSREWLVHMLQPLKPEDTSKDSPRLNVFVHMAGGATVAARKEFANSLQEALFDAEAQAVQPFKTLDDGISGYTFDLIPLHNAFLDPHPLDNISPNKPSARKTTVDLNLQPNIPSPETTAKLVPLLRASLDALPAAKLRVAHSAGSPHEILHLIRDVGIDLFDAHWAQRAADIGVALDFTFPAPLYSDRQQDLGHNIYDTRYAQDFSQFADCFAAPNGDTDTLSSRCPCIACTPQLPSHVIRHSTIDEATPKHSQNPYTRAYLHHLLHTHEMGANIFLASHNLCILDAFFAGVREVLSTRPEAFALETERFAQAYDGDLKIFLQARIDWAEVELARGKGRLAREKDKQKQDALGTAVELLD